MKIRLAQASDLTAASALWHERAALLQQTDFAFRPLPNARRAWEQQAAVWLEDRETAFFVAENDEGLVGFIAAGIVEGQAGLQPRRMGRVLEMVLDLHQPHPGLGRRLLACAKTWLKARGIKMMAVDSPARYPLEAAFWRSQGAKLRFHGYWMAV